MSTRYDLDDLEIEPRWVTFFFRNRQTGRGAHAASYTMCTGQFTGVKRPERGANHLL